MTNLQILPVVMLLSRLSSIPRYLSIMLTTLSTNSVSCGTCRSQFPRSRSVSTTYQHEDSGSQGVFLPPPSARTKHSPCLRHSVSRIHNIRGLWSLALRDLGALHLCSSTGQVFAPIISGMSKRWYYVGRLCDRFSYRDTKTQCLQKKSSATGF